MTLRKVRIRKGGLMLSFIICCSLVLRAQSKFLQAMPFYLDRDLVDAFKDSLIKLKVDTFVTYLTKSNNHDFTYFIWVKKGDMNVVKITDSLISAPQNARQHFIKKMNISKLAIEESESQLKLKPPIVVPEGCDIVFIQIHNKSYLIENGAYPHFQLNKSKNKYRSDFIESIWSDLSPLTDKWMYNRNYHRYPD